MSRAQASYLVAVSAGAAAGLFLAWQAAGTLLLIFAGLLFGVLLDSLMQGIRAVLPISRGWSLLVASLLLALVVSGLIVWSGYALVNQLDELIRTLNQQLRTLRGEIESLGLRPDGDPRTLAQILLPDPEQLFGHAQSAVFTAFGGFGSAVVIVLMGIFVAYDPDAYRRGALVFMPAERRARFGLVLDETADNLKRWLIGQVVAMAVLGVTLWLAFLAIGMPSALILAIQAALFNFIPYLGPFIGALPIVLVALPQGTEMLMWAMGIFVLAQLVEGYGLTPVIQKQAADLPPVLTLSGLMVFGTLFGTAGVALATPLIAALRVLVLRLYVEGHLGEDGRPRGDAPSLAQIDAVVD